MGKEWSRKEAHGCRASKARAWLASFRKSRAVRVHALSMQAEEADKLII